MATFFELSERLQKRFKNVPNVTSEDVSDWLEEALLEHGLSSSSNVPIDNESIILLFAQSHGAQQIAMSTAHYFKYTDGDEQVDKTVVSEQYRKLAMDLRAEYDRKKASTSSVKFMRRLDR